MEKVIKAPKFNIIKISLNKINCFYFVTPIAHVYKDTVDAKDSAVSHYARHFW